MSLGFHTEMVSEGHSAVLRAIKDLHKSDRYADLTLTLEDRVWKVHKVVVCPQSSFFREACDGPWIESQASKIELHDDEPMAIDALVEYFYTSDYTMKKFSPTTTDGLNGEPILSTLNAVVFKIADKYDVPTLALLAQLRFRMTSNGDQSTAGFAALIREIYENGPDSALGRDMRVALIDLLVTHEARYMTEPKFTEFRTVLRDVVTFGIDFGKASIDERLRRHAAQLAQMNENDAIVTQKARQMEDLARGKECMEHRANLTRLNRTFEEHRNNEVKQHGARLAEMTRHQLEGLDLQRAVVHHKARLTEMTTNQRKEMKLAQSQLGRDMLGEGEQRFRCRAEDCSNSFVALGGTDGLKCPYCSTPV